MKKSIKLFKEYGDIEASAVNDFLRLSFKAEIDGYDGLKTFFLEEAKEDIEHSTLISEFLSTINEFIEIKSSDLDSKINKIDTYKDYLTYFLNKEKSAVDFSSNIYKIALEENEHNIANAIQIQIEKHRNELYEAQEILDKFNQSNSILQFENWLMDKIKED